MASLPAAAAAAAVVVAILHWFPFLSLLYAAPVFFLRFRYGNRAVLASLPFIVALDLVVTATTLAASGSLSGDDIAAAAIGSAILSLPLAVAAFPFFPRDEYRITLAAVVSAALWAALALFTPAGAEMDEFLRAFSAEISRFFGETMRDMPDSSLILARLTEENLYVIARKTMLFSIFPAPLFAYSAGWRLGRWILERFRPSLVKPFSLASFYNAPVMFAPLALGMIGVIANRFVPNEWLETLSWNALIGSAFLFALQGFGIVRFMYSMLAARGKRPFLWAAPVLILAFATNGWVFLFGILTLAGVAELFIPLRARFVDKGAVDPTPGRGGDQKQ